MPNLDYNNAYENLNSSHDNKLDNVIKEINELANGRAEWKDKIDDKLINETLNGDLRTYLENNWEVAFILLAKINSLDSSTIDPDALKSVRSLVRVLAECYWVSQVNLAKDFKWKFNKLKDDYFVQAQNLGKTVDSLLVEGKKDEAQKAIDKIKSLINSAQGDINRMDENFWKINRTAAINELWNLTVDGAKWYLSEMNKLVNAAQQKVTAAESQKPQEEAVDNESDLEEVLDKWDKVGEELVNQINSLAWEWCDFLILNGDKLSYDTKKLSAFLDSFDQDKLKDYRKIVNRKPADIYKWRAINIAVQIIFKKLDGDNNRNPVNGVWLSWDSWLCNRIKQYQKENNIRSTWRLDWKTFESLRIGFIINGSSIVS